MSHNSRDDIGNQRVAHEVPQRVLKEHFVEDRHMLGLYYPKEPLVLRPRVLEEEPKIEIPEVEIITATDGRKTMKFKKRMTPAEKEAWYKYVHKRFPEIAVDDLNNWTERTQVRLDELAKKLEI